MNTRGVLLGLLLPCMAFSQGIAIKELQEFTAYPINRFDAQMEKRSFKRDYNSPKETPDLYAYTYRPRKTNPDKTPRNLFYEETPEILAVNYQTSSLKEAAQLDDEILKSGFQSANFSQNALTPVYYQKKDMTIRRSVEIIDSITFYSFHLEKRLLPDARAIVYAEDLLKMPSHEYLLTVFGPSNVRLDEFEGNKCTILFPNTSHEALFIWEDEKNNKDIAFILIGTVQMNISEKPVRQDNPWKTRQGIYIGMPLHDLQMINGKPVSFYGWATEQSGMLTPGNSGNIDFARLGLEFNCLDCDEWTYGNTSVINSEKAISDRRKIYVTTLVIHPEKTRVPVASR